MRHSISKSWKQAVPFKFRTCAGHSRSKQVAKAMTLHLSGSRAVFSPHPAAVSLANKPSSREAWQQPGTLCKGSNTHRRYRSATFEKMKSAVHRGGAPNGTKPSSWSASWLPNESRAGALDAEFMNAHTRPSRIYAIEHCAFWVH